MLFIQTRVGRCRQTPCEVVFYIIKIFATTSQLLINYETLIKVTIEILIYDSEMETTRAIIKEIRRGGKLESRAN